MALTWARRNLRPCPTFVVLSCAETFVGLCVHMLDLERLKAIEKGSIVEVRGCETLGETIVV